MEKATSVSRRENPCCRANCPAYLPTTHARAGPGVGLALPANPGASPLRRMDRNSVHSGPGIGRRPFRHTGANTARPNGYSAIASPPGRPPERSELTSQGAPDKSPSPKCSVGNGAVLSETGLQDSFSLTDTCPVSQLISTQRWRSLTTSVTRPPVDEPSGKKRTLPRP